MKAGDVVEFGIDNITETSVSVYGYILEEITDVNGNKHLVKGQKHRRGIALNDFESEEAFNKEIAAKIEKLTGKQDEVIGKMAVKDQTIDALKQEVDIKNNEIATLQAKLAKLEAN